VPDDWRPEGPDLARAFVEQRTGVTGQVALRRAHRRRAMSDQAWSGAGHDPRDPVAAGDVLASVLAARGWQPTLAVHSVTARWPEMVGPAIAAHTRVEAFEQGRLQVRCDSTAWATQLRLLVPELLARITAEAGTDLVRTITVLGPVAPSWVHGQRRVKGRGPRDTYG
jgi:predicted nucleic acid-binding Zn ribbon protein